MDAKDTKIKSARFVKGVGDNDPVFGDGTPQVAFIGRSNTGKSSVINSLVGRAGRNELAKTSSFPGRTQQINIFLVNGNLYLVDLPGYGYAKVPNKIKDTIREMINWYFFLSGSEQKVVVFIIDAKVGPTKDDLEFIGALDEYKKNTVVAVNKIDKLKQGELAGRLKEIKTLLGNHKIIPYSAKKSIGKEELLNAILPFGK